ncbi:MAG: inorganic diphosphatase [Gemmatimonadaceae bacterium]
MDAIKKMAPIDAESGDFNVIIETPKGSRNKFNYDPDIGLFSLKAVLPAGAVFPFDFGFIPGTLGEDGDPLDVLVLMDEPAFPGCHITARLIGAIEADQTEKDGEVQRNDRLIGVSADAKLYRQVKTLGDVDEALIEQIEHFFISYNMEKGKRFDPRERVGPRKAAKLVENGQKKSSRARRASKRRSASR